MSQRLNRIENRINALLKISPETLDLEDRVEYYTEYAAVLMDKKSYLINGGLYKTAANLQQTIVELVANIEALKEFLSESDKKYIKEHEKYVRAGIEQIHSGLTLTEIKSTLRQIYFGLPVEVKYDGEGYFIVFSYPGLNTDKQDAKLKEFAKESDFKVTTKKIDSKEYCYLNVLS